MGSKFSKSKTDRSKLLAEMPESILEKTFEYLKLEDLVSLQVAFPELKHRLRAYICSKRTLDIVVTSKHGVAGCWTNRFMLSYSSPHSKVTGEIKPLVDNEKGWNKLWSKKIIGGLRNYRSLRSLKLRGTGTNGGGVLIKEKWLKKLSEALPNLETLYLFHGVLVDYVSYEGPIGLYKVRVGMNSMRNWEKTTVRFSNLKTLKLGYPAKAVLDLIVQPAVLPNLERLFIMNKAYSPDEYLNRFTYYPESKLHELMHIPSKCRLPKQEPRDSNSSTEPGSALEIFLNRHKNQLKAFCFDPIPPKSMPKILNTLVQSSKIRKLALCEKNSHLTNERRTRRSEDDDKKLHKSLSEMEFACRNVENLFLDVGPDFPEFWFCGILRASAWTLRTLKLWNSSCLTTESLVEIRRLQNLEKLEFSRMKTLDCPTLQAILEGNGANLRVLIIRQCSAVTKSDILWVVNLECPNLAKLFINDGTQEDTF